MVPYITPNMQSFKAGADLSASTDLYKFVKAGTNDGEVVLCSALTDEPCGVLMSNGASGAAVDVAMVGGGAKVLAGGTIAAGARLGTTATGTAVSSQNTAICFAVALAAGVTGDYVPVVVVGPGPRKAVTVAAEATANGSDAASTQALANALKTTVNAILTSLKNAGVMS